MRSDGNTKSTSVSVGVAVGLYGISFGALSSVAGLDLWQTMALSLLMFSGASQFAFVGVVAAGGAASLPGAIVSSWLLGVRNGFYAIRMAPLLEVRGAKRLVAAQLTIDESTGVALSRQDSTESRIGFWWTGVAVYVFWNAMTFVGALVGQQIGDPSQWGLDAVAAASFVGLVWPRLVDLVSRTIAGVAFIVAVLASPFVPSGIPVLLSGLFGVVIAIFIKPTVES
jgi:predicted branched-subunit amino acid permease